MNPERATKPVIASYVSDFVKPDMLHVYRQITGQQRVTPWVFTHKREGEERFPFQKKRLVVLPKPRLRWWRRFVSKSIKREPWQLYRWELRHALLELVRADAKLLHVYFGHTAIHLRPLLRAFPHPTVVSFHGADAGVDMGKNAHRSAMEEVFAVADQIQARSQSLADDLVKLGCPPEKLRVQRTGIPLEEWSFVPRTTPADGAWRMLQSCRFIAKKGLDLTLRAFATAHREFPQAQLILAGDGPLKEELQKQAEKLGIAAAVTFTGFLAQDELRKHVYASHVFLHPSRTSKDGNREGIPNSMLEAMASGAPVIATQHGGIPEAVTDGESGLLVPEDDHEALAKALLSVLKDESLATKLGHGARKAVEEKFDRARNIRLLEDSYLELIARG
ncbi:glycosyltransferase involved in cell wall biosynthesis [Roseimicrobium gellanilyticum]|uniref:Glycosyltransferase involved in cell wall biosynthesis n=1 Tax=Roseimicrobium gellanilyticum TaxID=748857 RepID=A0A366HTV0_9BACT|nr:glycosyltransferase [Roseimicrobium gellanilyticum]RBP46344.1 glycosyltransferase involved in cell wall biosynthesis [Roseimicrobium gellanilyticum]